MKITDPKDINRIISEFHDTPTGRHQGVHRTVNRIKKYYYFSNMFSLVRAYIKQCVSCQRNKSYGSNKIPMEITTTSTKPFEKIFLDIVGPLPTSTNGKNFILTIQDDLSKYSLAIPLQNQTTEVVAEKFVKHFICIFGTPLKILTDQGSNFMSSMFQDMCKLLRIKKLNTSAYHPQTNGALERSHKTLTEYLRNFVDTDSVNWDTWMPFAMFCYNTTPHSSSGYMPFELVFGGKPRLPSSLKEDPSPIYNYDNYLYQLKYRLQTSAFQARKNLLDHKQHSKVYFDRNTHPLPIRAGEFVWLRNETKKNKFDSVWLGLYKVISENNTNVTIQIGKSHKQVHKNRIKISSS